MIDIGNYYSTPFTKDNFMLMLTNIPAGKQYDATNIITLVLGYSSAEAWAIIQNLPCIIACRMTEAEAIQLFLLFTSTTAECVLLRDGDVIKPIELSGVCNLQTPILGPDNRIRHYFKHNIVRVPQYPEYKPEPISLPGYRKDIPFPMKPNRERVFLSIKT